MNLGRIESRCFSCKQVTFDRPVGGFFHDVRCWGWKTALYNVWYRLRYDE